MSGSPDISPSSISTAGYEDGLGRRSVRFNREVGGMLECLHLRSQFIVFEASLRERAAALARLDDERFAVVREFEKDASGLRVISDLVTGQRLIDVLETRSEDAAVSGIDAAFGFLLQAMPALAQLHAQSITHGAVAPGRIIITPNSQVVLLDNIYGSALERLSPTRQTLWTAYGVMAAPVGGSASLDRQSDVGQVALCALLLALGRPLDQGAGVASLVPLVREIAELAEIRAGSRFAEGVSRFFIDALPAVGKKRTMEADEATSVVRQLLTHISEDESLSALAELVTYRPALTRTRVDAATDVIRPRTAAAAVTAVRPPAPIEIAAPPASTAKAVPEPPAPEPAVVVAPQTEPVHQEDATPTVAAVAAPPAPTAVLTPAVAVAVSSPMVSPAVTAPAEAPSVVPEPVSPAQLIAPAPAAPWTTLAALTVPVSEAAAAWTPPPPPVGPQWTPPATAAWNPPPPTPAAGYPPAVPAQAPRIPVAPPRYPAPMPGPVMPPINVLPQGSPALTIRHETHAPHAPIRVKEAPRAPEADRTARPVSFLDRVEEPRRPFPWKIAAAAALVLLVAGAAGRDYLVGRANAAPSEASTSPSAPPVVTSTTTGGLVIDSQPSGAKVSLDGKEVGTTPLTLEAIKPGRHQVTIASGSALVQRSVRIEAGKQATINVPVFSGWVAVFAPIRLEVAAGRRSLGSTEDGRILLPPGKHVLTLSSAEFGYTRTETVEISPGEERVLNLLPTGTVNLNASPWAEVWIDGKRAGETPLANLEVPLGTREFVFKHPQFGERKLTATITMTNSPLSVDFGRPPSTP